MWPIPHEAYYLLPGMVLAADSARESHHCSAHKNAENSPCPEVVFEKDECILTYIIQFATNHKNKGEAAWKNAYTYAVIIWSNATETFWVKPFETLETLSC